MCINLLLEIFHSLPTQTPVRTSALEHSFNPILIKGMLASSLCRPTGLYSRLGKFYWMYTVMGQLSATIES